MALKKLKIGKKAGNKEDSIFSHLGIEHPEEENHRSSFEELEPMVQEPRPSGRKFITSSYVVDKFTVKRTRELLTPSRCTTPGCNFDIAKHNGFLRGWNSVPARERPLLLEALNEHVQMIHNRSEEFIIDEEEMPKRWLGAERGLKGL